MKSMLVAAAALLMLGACHYEFAAVQPNELPIDAKLIGKWIQREASDDGSFRQKLAIVPSRQGGAIAHLWVEADACWCFRGHSLGKDLPGLYQLEFLGSASGDQVEERPFTVASVKVEGGSLAWRLIDEKKVGEVKDGDALLQRIRKAVRNKEDLFAVGQVFTPDR